MSNTDPFADLIAMAQRGGKPEELPDPDLKGKQVLKQKQPAKPPEKEAAAAPSIQALVGKYQNQSGPTGVIVGKKAGPVENSNGRFKIPLINVSEYYNELVVYTTAEAREQALGEYVDAIPEKTLFVFYNVKSAALFNGRNETLRYYFLAGYDSFEFVSLLPGASFTTDDSKGYGLAGNVMKHMKHMIVTSVDAEAMDSFEFIKTWLPMDAPKKGAVKKVTPKDLGYDKPLGGVLW